MFFLNNAKVKKIEFQWGVQQRRNRMENLKEDIRQYNVLLDCLIHTLGLMYGERSGDNANTTNNVGG